MPTLLLKEIRHNPLLWLLVFVPAVFAGEKLAPDAHTLFVLYVLAVGPVWAGTSIVFLGSILVGITMALGG